MPSKPQKNLLLYPQNGSCPAHRLDPPISSVRNPVIRTRKKENVWTRGRTKTRVTICRADCGGCRTHAANSFIPEEKLAEREEEGGRGVDRVGHLRRRPSVH